jgi:antitoxin (DNA-binding transcriptional repressor) of toxin-antitoxin stability system
MGDMTPKEITSTRLAQAPGAVVDEVLASGTTWLTRSGRRVVALVPHDQFQRAEYERDLLWAQLGRLMQAVTGHWPGNHAVSLEQLVELTEKAITDTTREP